MSSDLSHPVLERALVQLIASCCNLPGAPADVPDDAPLIGPDSPLDLDSLDAVEIVVAVQKAYAVHIGGTADTARDVLQSLGTLAGFIRRERGGAA